METLKRLQPVGWLIWFIWFVLFVWLNETNQMNQTNQIDQTNLFFCFGLLAVGQSAHHN